MSTFIFLWLQNQIFYNQLQKNVLSPISVADNTKSWADIGCSTGLITRLAQKLGYGVTGYDINDFSLLVAKILSLTKKNITYKNEDFHTLKTKFDIVSATSLLSVVEDKEKSLASLISLLKDENSTLIIIEPSALMSRDNVWKKIDGIKTFWYYKGLLLWAKAREGKHIDTALFEDLKGVNIEQKYYLHEMVCVSYITKKT